MPAQPRPFAANLILACLTPAEARRLARYLEPKDFALGEILNEPETSPSFTYFPVGCMVSFVALTEGGGSLEVGIIGREGMVGVAIALGISEAPVRAIIQGAGKAIRIPAAEFAVLVQKNVSLRAAAHRYAYTSMATAMIVAACNSKHSLEARLARWLLMMRDCTATTTFQITQNFLGQMLGVRRPSVNVVANELQRRGLIKHSRGVVKLLDLEGLEAASCSCYAKISRMIDRVGGS